MNKFQKVLAYGSALGGLMAVNPLAALAQVDPDTVNITPPTEFAGLNNIRPSGVISMIINILLGGAGVIAFIFLLWGGLQWILAGGDKEGTEKARKRITSALIGLAIVFSAYALLYILRALFNIDLIRFNITGINGTS